MLDGRGGGGGGGDSDVDGVTGGDDGLCVQYADTDLKCWMDVEAWRRIAPTEERKRDQKAKDIKKAYLNKKYFFGPNSPAGKHGQNKVLVVAAVVVCCLLFVVCCCQPRNRRSFQF